MADFENFKLFLQNKYEPKKSDRFALYFEDIPQISADGTKKVNATGIAKSSLLLSVAEAKRPTYKVGESMIKRFNDPIFTAGAVEYDQEMPVVFYDYINNSPTSTGDNALAEENSNSTAALYRWYNSIYNVEKGSMGYKSEYTTNGYLYLLDPHGTEIEVWKMWNIFPIKVTYGELTYEGSENLKVSATFAFDLPELVSVGGVQKTKSYLSSAPLVAIT